MNPTRNLPGRRAFTLIELLTVVAIIALLAALIMWGTTAAGEKKVRNRVLSELNGLQLAIDGFHKQFGFYPASNPNVTMTDMHPLFYELTGTVHDSLAKNFTDFLGTTVNSDLEIKPKFGVAGFVNSKDKQSSDNSQAQNFLPGLPAGGYAQVPSSSLRVLVVPYKGPRGDFNPWHYNSTSPNNNPDSYDLWAEVVVAGKTNIIGNWKD